MHSVMKTSACGMEAESRVQSLGRAILESEGNAVRRLARLIDRDFERAIELLAACRGHVVLTGIGKAGLIGQKISATLASTGTPSYFLHPCEGLHGDLGRLRRDDLVLALSYSGETEEVIRFAFHAARLSVPIVAMTGNPRSRLAAASHLTLAIGELVEADPLRLAPSTSTTVMLAFGDALALTLADYRGFGKNDFARFHPGGSLGLELAHVEDIMRPLEHCRVAQASMSARQVLAEVRRPGRRTGAIMLVDEPGTLVGVFTDSDLARLFEQHRENLLDCPIRDIMTKDPYRIEVGSPFGDALSLLRQHRISELPVVDSREHPLGLIDITDVMGLLPKVEETSVAPGRDLRAILPMVSALPRTA